MATPKPDPRRQDTEVTEVEGKDIEEVARDPSIERGERLDSGKTIARGGKDDGHVPGATAESTPDK
jgi:hypothetical protein